MVALTRSFRRHACRFCVCSPRPSGEENGAFSKDRAIHASPCNTTSNKDLRHHTTHTQPEPRAVASRPLAPRNRRWERAPSLDARRRPTGPGDGWRPPAARHASRIPGTRQRGRDPHATPRHERAPALRRPRNHPRAPDGATAQPRGPRCHGRPSRRYCPEPSRSPSATSPGKCTPSRPP